MEVITRQKNADGAYFRWWKQYPKGHPYGEQINKAGTELKALGKHPNPDLVDRIIGSGTWTEVPDCDECGATCNAVVRVGQEPDYESCTADLCEKCLRAALKLIEKEGKRAKTDTA